MGAARFADPGAVARARGADGAARVQWIDVAKGIGILLVVAGHAIGGLIDAGIAPTPDWFRPLLLAIYLFHMPLFFLLSGLFVPDRLRDGPAALGGRLLTRLAWPYLLWATVQILVVSAAGSLVNTPVEDLGTSLAALLHTPPSQFWFLYVLAIMQVLAMLLLPRIGAGGFLALALLAFAIAPADLPVVPAHAARMLPFFALGCLLGARGWAAAPKALGGCTAAAIALAAVLLCAATAAALIGMGGPEAFADTRTNAIVGMTWHPLSLAAAVAGVAAVAALAARLQGPAGRALAYLGNRSMAIYLLHIIPLAGTRILMAKAFGMDTPALLPLLLLVGTLAPLAAAEVARRLRIARALGL